MTAVKRIFRQVRQGDVLVTPITAIPASAKQVKSKRRIVLAKGEATGHHHAIDYQAKQMAVFVDGPMLYLRVKSPVVLHHQEHAPATIEPGDYIVKRQVEVWLDEVRRVAD
jgi:hypothetical protein